MYSVRVWIECPCIIMSVQCPMCMFSLLSEYTGRSLVINNYGSIDPLDPCILQGYQVDNNYTFINITIVYNITVCNWIGMLCVSYTNLHLFLCN